MPALGSYIVWHNQALHLLPQFYVANALLKAGHVAEQAVWRVASLHAQMVCIVLEVLWSSYHPAPLSERAAAAGLLGAAALNALQLALLYGLVDDGPEYTDQLGLALNVARGILLIPSSQVGSAWTLHQGAERSQSRWRIAGWITTIALGLVALLFPAAISPAAVLFTVSVPSLLAAGMLLTAPESRLTGPGSAPAHRVSWGSAALFFLGACVLGTNGEGLLDSAVGLAVRGSLARGNSQLAVANQVAVLTSMLLALISETSLMQGSAAQRGSVFILLWLPVQVGPPVTHEFCGHRIACADTSCN
jgi:hypothetical protein